MSKGKKRLLHFSVTVGLLVAGSLGMVTLIAGKPELERQKPPISLPIVRTKIIRTGPQCIRISGEGTVRPLEEINLVPEVGGKLVYVSPALVNGGEFSKDDLLLRIDPVDYQLALTMAKAKVKDSESILELAEEEAGAAQEEWRLLHSGNPKADKRPPPLVAKEPQLSAAQARLAADQADLRKALLNLERTELKAPFDGRVTQENVDIGQYVSPGQVLASLYSTRAAEIVLPLEDEDLFWFRAPGFTSGEGPGSSATVKARIAGRELSWAGEVVRSEGKLDERTRMINVVVRVNEPYAKMPPLAMGLFVSVDIKGRCLPNAAVIPRGALRQGDLVWVVDDKGVLRFRKVDVARFEDREVIVREGLKDGEAVAISPLKVVSDGMSVRGVLMAEWGEQ